MYASLIRDAKRNYYIKGKFGCTCTRLCLYKNCSASVHGKKFFKIVECNKINESKL